MNKIFFLIITLTLLFSGCMISSNTIYKISKSYVGEYKLSDTTCVVINLMLYNKKWDIAYYRNKKEKWI